MQPGPGPVRAARIPMPEIHLTVVFPSTPWACFCQKLTVAVVCTGARSGLVYTGGVHGVVVRGGSTRGVG